MTQLAENRTSHLSNFNRVQREVTTVSHPSFNTLRQTAMDRFNETGFPGRKEEEWRFTNLDPIIKTHFTLAASVRDAGDIESGEKFSFASAAVTELVFINGHYMPQIS